MVKIVDGVVVFDAPVHLKQGGEVGVEGDADTKLTVNAGFKVVGMTNLNSLRVRYTSQLGVEWKGKLWGMGRHGAWATRQPDDAPTPQ